VGSYVNTTGNVAATLGGTVVIGAPATDSLAIVSVPLLTKEFTDDPAVSGGTVTLRFTLSHENTALVDATGIAFADDLDAALAGLTATGLPLTDICGVGSHVSGTSNLSFTGGTLAPGTSCTFDVTLQVPAGAGGSYVNTTSVLTASVGGVPVIGAPATDTLVVISPLSLAKAFIDDPVNPGGTVTLRFTIDNLDQDDGATAVVFSDDLEAMLPGTSIGGRLPRQPCGADSFFTFASGILVLNEGSLPAGASCSFDVTLQVPAAASAGTSYTNTTSPVTGTVGGSPMTGGPATDDLRVGFLDFTKAFGNPVAAGEATTLTFTIENLHPTIAYGELSFTDDLASALSGLVATDLPGAGFCGPGSVFAGTSQLTMSGGSLGAGATCTFSVTVQIPATAVPASYPSTTGSLTSAGLTVAAPAAAMLEVVAGAGGYPLPFILLLLLD
jgi:hypothetical protein